MTAEMWIAVITCALAGALLIDGPRTGALRDRASPVRVCPKDAWWHRLWPSSTDQRSRTRMPSGGHMRLGAAAGVVAWLTAGGGWGGWVAAAVVGLGTVAVCARLESGPERRRRALLVAQLPGCLDLLAAALDAGVPLRAAVRHVAALAPEPSGDLLRGVLGHLDIGRSDAQSWQTLGDDPVWGAVARDLARCADSGAAVSEVLGVHAAEARAGRNAQREARTRAVGVRSVLPLVMCFLPAFVLVGVVPIIAATLDSFLHP